MEIFEKAAVMDEAGIARAIARLAAEIAEHNRGVDGLVLVGIRRRGLPLAERIADRLAEIEGERPEVAALDIGFYGDDLSLLAPQPIVRESPLPSHLEGATVVLVDDVLYTGRTIYAAVAHLLDHARPRRIQLAVLVDRGHRELPVEADYVGRAFPTKGEEIVKVMLSDLDGAEKVLIVELVKGVEGVQ